MIKMLKTIIFLIISLMFFNMVMAADYTVGGSTGGWDQSTDLSSWCSSETFLEGDNLVFRYSINHDVTEVSEPDFNSCTATNPLSPPHTGGATVIPLTSAGTRYFICGTAGHCIGGMKIKVTTLAASTPPPPTTPVASPPPPSTTPTVSSPPPSTTPTVSSPPPSTTPAVPSPPPSTTPAVPSPPPSTTPAAPSPPPKPSPAGHPVSSPPSKTTGPSPSPRHSGVVSPPPSVSGPTPNGSSFPPSPAPSSAAKFDVMGALTGLVVMAFFINV